MVPLLPLNLEIRVAGRGGEWIKRRSPKVRWAGVVPSAGAFLRSARVIAVPSVTGGGVQVKALDAISAGRPVVATSTALRGIHDLPGYVVCVDDPAQFAASLSESVSGVTTGDAVIEGQAWASQRRERFVLAVNAAVLALAAES